LELSSTAIMLLVVLIVSSAWAFDLPTNREEISSGILGQFLDYDLVIHFDSTAIPHLDKIFATKNHEHQAVHLVNYDEVNRIKTRPKGYKYVNIVHLQNPFDFESYSSIDYNLYQFDVVLFILEDYTTAQIHSSQIWRITGLDGASSIFIYSDGLMFYCCYYCGNATAILQEIPTEGLRQRLNDYSDFNGHVFKIAYTDFPPFFWREDGSYRAQGAEGELLHEFSKVHNFKYDLISYRNEGRKGAWQAMVEGVQSRDVDWAVGGLSVSIKRGIYTDFTRYIKTQGFAVLYATYEQTWTVFESFLLVFEWLVWICIGSSIVGVCCVSKIVDSRRSCWYYVKLALMSIVEQTASALQMRFLKVSCLRLIFAIWWLSLLSLTSVYKSQLASTLIKPSFKEPGRIEALVERGFKFQVNKEDWSVLKENLVSSLDDVYAKVLRAVDDDLEFCQSVVAACGEKIAVIDEEIPIQYDINRRCINIITPEELSRLRLINENIFPSTYHAWSMRVGLPFRLTFSKTIGRMDDYGLIHHCFFNFFWKNSHQVAINVMGAFLGKIWNRFWEFPIKRKPICFYMQKNFTTTGEEKFEDEEEVEDDPFKELQDKIVEKLTQASKEDENWHENLFPHWDKLTIDNLNNIFILFASSTNGMMDFHNFCKCLDSFGDSTPRTIRLEKFKKQDTDEDRFINYDEFLSLVYNFDSVDEIERLRGVAKTCYDLAQQIRSVNSLSIGEQLQQGLF
ncbi:uncharacterized protein BDFB_004391, partial [Asbolus verrucosus]